MAINVTGRTPNCKARNRSHALNKTNRKQKLNLQIVRNFVHILNASRFIFSILN